MAMRLTTVGLAVVLLGLTVSSGHAEYPIAGVHPERRPDGAPVISKVERDQAWYAHALRGVEKPYPNSLIFLENQGNWFTPFTRPGMTGLYDLRGLHAQ